MIRKLPWFEIALSIVFLSAFVYAAFSDAYNMPNRWFIRDDAYYYFKVAQNISEGHGSTFDGIHPTNGYHPLWLLICIPIFALARYDLILPLRVLVIVTGLLQITTAILLYRLIRSVVSPPMAMLAAAYWVFNTYILLFLYKTGVESSIALLFIVLLLYLAYRLERTWRSEAPGIMQLAILGAVAALVVFSRLDLVFFALVMGIWIVLRNSPARYLLPLDLLSIVLSVLGAFIARLGFVGYYDSSGAAITMIVAGVLIKAPTLFAFGLYGRPSTWRPLPLLLRAVLAVATSSLILAAALVIGGALHLFPAVSRFVLALDAGLTLGLVVLIRILAFAFSPRKGSPQSVSPLTELRSNWRPWLCDAAVYYGIVGGSLSLYMIWNRLVFGDFSPVSGQVKRWWGTFLISVYGGPAKTWLSFFFVDPNSEFNAWQPALTRVREWSNSLLYSDPTLFGNPAWQQRFVVVLIVTFVALLLVLLLTRRKSGRVVMQASLVPLFVGSWFQTLSYNATGYASPKEWYWLTQPILLILVGVLLMQVVIELLLKRWLITRLLVWGIVAGWSINAGLAYWRDAVALNPYGGSPPNAPYADVVPFLEENTPPGAIIGMTGGGNVGYFIHDRTIVNMDGLINSTEYFKDLQAGSSAGYLYDSGMRYVFANPDLLSANPYRGQYDSRLEPIESWGGKRLMKLLPDPSE